jgi:HSP20 family molecular chaperone IbpA
MPYFLSHGNLGHQQPRSTLDPLDPIVQVILSQLANNQGSSHPSNAKKHVQHPSHQASSKSESNKYKNHTFSPKFDVYETSDSYHLEGEFPGLSDKSRIDIEPTSESTLLIRGHLDTSQSGSATEESKEAKRKSLKPTVEDGEDEDDFSVVSTNAEKGKQKSVQEHNENQSQQNPGHKIWLSERVCGDFKRTFSFPSPVNLEKSVARLDAGVLHIRVPKAVFTGARRIEIS